MISSDRIEALRAEILGLAKIADKRIDGPDIVNGYISAGLAAAYTTCADLLANVLREEEKEK